MYSLGAIEPAGNGGGTVTVAPITSAPKPLIHPVLAPIPTSIESSPTTIAPLIHPILAAEIEAAVTPPPLPTSGPLAPSELIESIYGPELDPDADNILIHPVLTRDDLRKAKQAAAAGPPTGAAGWLLLLALGGAIVARGSGV